MEALTAYPHFAPGRLPQLYPHPPSIAESRRSAADFPLSANRGGLVSLAFGDETRRRLLDPHFELRQYGAALAARRDRRQDLDDDASRAFQKRPSSPEQSRIYRHRHQ